MGYAVQVSPAFVLTSSPSSVTAVRERVRSSATSAVMRLFGTSRVFQVRPRSWVRRIVPALNWSPLTAYHQRSGCLASMTTLPPPPATGRRLSWVQVAPLSVVSHGPTLPVWVRTACLGSLGAMVISPASELGPTGCHRSPRLSAGVTSKPAEPTRRCRVVATPLTETWYAPASLTVTAAS